MPALLSYPEFAILSELLDDVESQRMATANRLRYLTGTEVDSDGTMRALALPADAPIPAVTKSLLDSLEAQEKELIKALQKQIRLTPFANWIKTNKGVGEKQAARLIASLGDPYFMERVLKDENNKEVGVVSRPRTVGELWSYAGYGVQDGSARRRKKGEHANWNPVARSRAFLIAESCIKQLDGGYRAFYDQARVKYADAVHPTECHRCGPAGKPAPAGSPLSLGHQHARALRIVSKQILLDLWLVARDYHEAQELRIAA